MQGVWHNYLNRTPQRVKLIDAFMAFLVIVGGLQFVYCVLAGNYVRSARRCRTYLGFWQSRPADVAASGRPWALSLIRDLCIFSRGGRGNADRSLQPFNAFLSGFSATVGQFVLTASLRIQTNPENKGEFESISNER